jgi:8-hydroxy-5-deazaflavin:NADPH oxidoreductase
MKIGVLGTGMVGQTIASKLVELGHAVQMGSRTAANEKASAWAANAGVRASSGTFTDSAKFGEMVFHCTQGAVALEVLNSAGASNLKGKILVDVSNPLDPKEHGQLLYCNTESLGERIQEAFPESKVVKTFNTMWCGLMVNPRRLKDSHTNFISGNDQAAKASVTDLLVAIGWRKEEIVDLGDITGARGTEMLLSVWLRLFKVTGDGTFNFKIAR